MGGSESGQLFGSFPTTYTEQVLLIDPGQFRVINELLRNECKGKGKLETLTFAATAEAN